MYEKNQLFGKLKCARVGPPKCRIRQLCNAFTRAIVGSVRERFNKLTNLRRRDKNQIAGTKWRNGEEKKWNYQSGKPERLQIIFDELSRRHCEVSDSNYPLFSLCSTFHMRLIIFCWRWQWHKFEERWKSEGQFGFLSQHITRDQRACFFATFKLR